ncbi:phage tail tape measure protein [Pseudomonas abietaniphila]|uniref:Phage tail tape measure protein, lambda family n=1 Tax=Pseudomonas abietaniphila TaxID=89065 RepID=A0A1G8K8D0_9PSED|nr:phage tail tape measure protein [Pseudomonas abietaniphila]SDI39671.1 phage tail tape measure protein, lambda family [Pseudomonas abietaniphila]
MAVDSLGQLTVDLVANTGGFEKGMDRAQRALKAATKEAAYQAGQLDKLVGQIDPVVGAYGRLDKMEEQLRKHRAAGRLEKSDFDEYLKKLNEQREAIGKTDAVMAKGAMSAKAYNAALRGVPAQFTDIAVSLQGGQAPLTVFLQQGGQLKDMFGGIGPAAKALGGYVLGLVNPFTVAAAAAAVLALAYKQGSDEASAYRQALILTGSASGATVDGLETLAKSVSGTTGTVGAASEVLVQLASSGKIPVSSFDSIAVAALKMQEATGKAASETVADFEKIAQDPVKASKALNDQLHYLTAATYEQIDALVRQGDQQGAVSLAEEAYAQALSGRADKIKSNLGSIESGWNTVKSAAKGAWDAILDIGREKTFEEKMALLQEQLANAGRIGSGPRGGGGRGTSQVQSDITDLGLSQQEKLNRQAAQALYQSIQDKGIKGRESFNKGLEDTASKAEKMAAELKKARTEIEDINRAAKVNGTAGVSDADAQRRLDGIREKYKETGPKPKAYTEDAGIKALDSARQQYAALQQQGALIGDQNAASQTLGANAKKLVEWEQQLADIKTKKTLTADQKSLLASQDLITAQLKRNAALETQNTLSEKALETRRKLAAFDENLQSQLASAKQGLDNNLAGVGLGDLQKQRLQEQLSIQQSYQSQLDKLTSDYNKSNKDQFSTELYDKETASLKTALDQRLAYQRQYYVDVDKAQADWTNGASSAYQDYLQSAKDVAGQTKNLFSNAFSGMEDAIVNFALTGKASFGDFAKSVLADLVRIEARQATSSGLSALFGLASSAAGAYFGGSTSAGSTQSGYTGAAYQSWLSSQHWDGGYTGDGGKYQPMGVVHGGEVVIRKEVVQQPGMRQYLERLNKNGKGYADGGYVGLSSSGSGSSAPAAAGGSIVIQQNFTVDGSGNNTSDRDMQAVGQAYADTAKRGAQQAIAEELRPGGAIWRVVNGR